MKLCHWLIVTVSVLQTACSPINSMAPFDDKQAAIIARSMVGSPLTQRHQLPVQGKTKQGANQNNNSSET
jgi:hypothetical protein